MSGANYDGLTRNAWPGTWSPTANHPIVIDKEIRGGLRSVSGQLGDRLTDITGQRLEVGMIVYLVTGYTDNEKEFLGGNYYKYESLIGEVRNENTGDLPNSNNNWSLFQGAAGYTGSQGDIGYTGSQGELGYTGSQGDIGYTGSAGVDGIIGSDGYTGSQGEIGYTGSAVEGLISDGISTITIQSGYTLVFPDGSGQITAAPRMYTNADAENGLSLSDLKPGDYYYDDINAAIYICYDTGLGYFDILDLTVRA
jgi:hypothetical protein